MAKDESRRDRWVKASQRLRNERAVAEATSWLKRIVVTWIVLNTLGFVVAYLQPLIQGGQYTPSTTP